MHDMVDEHSIHNQPIDAEILPGDHIAIAAFQQFGISASLGSEPDSGKRSNRERESKIRSVIFRAEFGPTRFM